MLWMKLAGGADHEAELQSGDWDNRLRYDADAAADWELSGRSMFGASLAGVVQH